MNANKLKNVEIKICQPFIKDNGKFPGALWTARSKTSQTTYDQESFCYIFDATMIQNGIEFHVQALVDQFEADKVIIFDCRFNDEYDEILEAGLDKLMAIHMAEYHASRLDVLGIEMSDVFYLENFSGSGKDAAFAEFTRGEFSIDFGFFVNKDMKGDVMHLLENGVEMNVDDEFSSESDFEESLSYYLAFYENPNSKLVTINNVKFGLGLYMMRNIEKELQEEMNQ